MRACVQLSAILYVLFLRKEFLLGSLELACSLFTLAAGVFSHLFIYFCIHSSFSICVSFFLSLSLCIRFVCLLVWLFVRSFCFYYTENLFEFRFSFNLNYMHTRWKSSSFFPICHALHFANSAWFTRFFLASSARAFRLVCVVCCWCMCKNSKPISYQTRHQQQSALRHVGYTIQSRPY